MNVEATTVQEKPAASVPMLMRAATTAAVAAAAVLVTVKVAAYIATDSVSLLSSLADSALDLLASGLNFVAVRQALAPADREHRFGHGKAEPLSALGQSAFIAGSAVLLTVEAASRFRNPVPVQNGEIGIAVMVFAIIVTAALVIFQRFVVRKSGSTAIGADLTHYAGDVLLNFSVVAALVANTYLGIAWADPVFGVGIAIFLVVNAGRIAMKAVADLMDHELPDADRDRIKAVVRQHPKVKGVHELRTRSSGVQQFIQMHIVLEEGMTLLEAHRISDQVEAALQAEFPHADIILHQDPEGVIEYHQPVGAGLH